MPKPKNCSCVCPVKEASFTDGFALRTSAIHGGRIEFIYERSCPNVADARMQLRLALEQTGLPARWEEWEHSDPNSPAYARRYGSPSILVDGRDIAGEPGSDAPSCRIYANTQGRNRGVPDAALIRTALEHSMGSPESPGCKC
jgi:hypothetical protein